MKKLLTVALFTLFAGTAIAQVPMARPNANGIIYSNNPLPPIISNNRIVYAPGSPYVDATGQTRACNTSIVVDHADPRNTHAVCGDKPAISADNFSQLAPAAGGPHALTDRNLVSDNLSSDSVNGLRNDHSLIGAQ